MEIDYKNSPELKKLHSLELIIAKEIKRICDIENIDYFLAFGSLLGAVRHKGFIPWDDDMDIGMTRENYEKFLAVFNKHTDKNKFYLEDWSTEKDYPLAFAKVKLNNTVFMENSIKGTCVHKGIYVDVFPFDICNENEKIRNMKKSVFDILAKLLKFKMGYRPTNPNDNLQLIIRNIMKVCGIIVPKRLIKGLMKSIELSSKNGESSLIWCIYSVYKNDVFDKDCLNEYTMLRFEDTEFSVPKDYDRVLRASYNNYNELPPENKRKLRHFPDKIDFGEYL